MDECAEGDGEEALGMKVTAGMHENAYSCRIRGCFVRVEGFQGRTRHFGLSICRTCA